MLLATYVMTLCFALATALFLLVDASDVLRMRSVWLWSFVALILMGSVAGGLRGIVLSTRVTLLVPADRRDRGNGLVGNLPRGMVAIKSGLCGSRMRVVLGKECVRV